MGEVYLARDRDLPRPVALKLLSPVIGDDGEVRARFLREADTAARLAHPNIVAVYARGQEQDRLWMAMQYIEGTDVTTALREGPIRPGDAVRITVETAKALDHAHRSGVLHRDVKPANILLEWGPQRQVYLTDFGIAKALDRADGLTRTGELYASFQYAAPELFEMRADTDHRADVYALGCTLYYMLTGVLPYPGDSTGQLINAHLNAPIPRPSEHDPAVPSTFDEVIARAMAKNRGDRFGSCGELAAAARRALTTVPAAPHPEPVSRWRRARTPIAAATAAIAVFVSAAVATVVLRGGDSEASTPPAGAQAAAEQAACDYSKLMGTYDYDDPAGWERSVHDGATGEWATQAAGILPMVGMLVGSDPVRSRASDAECTATMSEADTVADVDVLLTQVNSPPGKPDETEQITMSTRMELVDGKWLCSRLVTPLLPN
ncbi:serine/threonine protein kinase [Nocardia cyriacigeorgica]|uniref:non-specific serine/threonine protein kinase n=2 Tax=Nocardia cyriacigeorgica TaxID=135487 RepID=A0A6P1D9G1_9NOCA|nr:serine/threonine protein kinase [Nocardia cyriacigeorgica]NEW45383.1 serine/threonine protein kinase [Nocardia cyriacigeorgica]NEW48554.1 serine/threonine protein kinase [Nocardia cyriacigeorgica]NEW57914.1 serine/threonine protein kinase [Nocardia cyriacigeorgica]